MRLALFLLLLSAALTAQADGNWSRFRGSDASGVAEGYSLPVRWNLSTGENVLWRVEVPGLGHSSPVIWGDRIYLTTAVGATKQAIRIGTYGDGTEAEDDVSYSWKVLCYDKKTGELLWEKVLYNGPPKSKRHVKASHANTSVAVDAEHIVAFLGSEGLFCLDHKGEVVWKKDLGVFKSGPFGPYDLTWGFASSPVIYGSRVIVLADHLGDSFLAALSLEDGTEQWRVARDEDTTWGTPLVATASGKTQVVVNAYRNTAGYDIETGKRIWRMSGGGDIPTPSPVHGRGKFFFTSGHGEMQPVYALRDDFRGDGFVKPDSDKGVAWIVRRRGSYMQTPLLMGDLLYVPRWRGTTACFRADTGEELYHERLGAGTFTASPVGGDGKVYVASEEGDVYVLAAGEPFRILATNSMGEPTLASPAISEEVIYFRTTQSLIAIRNNKKP